jgi:hypothetical protein
LNRVRDILFYEGVALIHGLLLWCFVWGREVVVKSKHNILANITLYLVILALLAILKEENLNLTVVVILNSLRSS